MTSPWISTAAMIAMAIAKAAAEANKAITYNKEGAGNFGGGGGATPALPGLQGGGQGPTPGSVPTGMTNPNAFAPPTGPHGQWNLNPFTVSGGANAGMPDLGMGSPAVGPIGANLPPLQQDLSSVSRPTNHLSLMGQGPANPFGGFGGGSFGGGGAGGSWDGGGGISSTPSPSMSPPMPQTAPPTMSPLTIPQAAPPTVSNPNLFQGGYPWG